MTIKYSKQFKKQFQKLSRKDQERFWERLDWFILDTFDVRLNNHLLQGKLQGHRSINITGDIRAIYVVIDGNIYLYEMIGPHSQLYG